MGSIKHTVNTIFKRNSLASIKRGKVISKFADSLGLVYFGTVDQHKDDHKLVRGLTASTKHLDEHYCVGPYEDYDVSLIYRTDIINDKPHSWMIVAMELNNKQEIPHFFMGDHKHENSAYSQLFVAKSAMQKIPLGTLGRYSQEFTSRYSLFAKSDDFITTESLITPQVAQSVAAHFWPLSVELWDDVLYIYSDNSEVTPRLLEAMLKNGIWLASQFDKK